MSLLAAVLLSCVAVAALFGAMLLIPLVIGAFLQMLPYLIVLALLWWVLR